MWVSQRKTGDYIVGADQILPLGDRPAMSTPVELKYQGSNASAASKWQSTKPKVVSNLSFNEPVLKNRRYNTPVPVGSD